MAEAVGIVAASLEIGKTIVRVRSKFQAIRNAPHEIQSLLEEVESLSCILKILASQQAMLESCMLPTTEWAGAYQMCLNAATTLLYVLNELQDGIQKSRWRGSLKAVSKESTVYNLKQKLDSVKSTLILAQLALNSILDHRTVLQHADTNALLGVVAVQTATGTATNRHKNSNQLRLDRAVQAGHGHSPDFNKRKGIAQKGWQFSYITPTRLLGIVCQVQAWRWCNEWTINFKTFNAVADDSPIFWYARNGDSDSVRDLLSTRQASVYDMNSRGETPLHTDVVQLLINEHADVNCRNQRKQTSFASMYEAVSHLCSNPYKRWAFSSKRPDNLALIAGLLIDKQPDDLIRACTSLSQWWDYGWWFEEGDTPVLETTKLIMVQSYPTYFGKPLREKLTWAVRCLADAAMFELRLGGKLGIRCVDFRTWRYGVNGSTPIWDPQIKKWYSLWRKYTSIWEPIALAFGRLQQSNRKPVKESRIIGWRQLLTRLIELDGIDHIGSSYPLYSFLIGTQCFNGALTQEMLNQHVQNWISELQRAGLNGENLRTYAQHEQDHLHNIRIMLPTRSTGLRERSLGIIGLETGTEPSSWYLWVSWTLDEQAGTFWAMIEHSKAATEEETVMELNTQSKMPGAWMEDNIKY